MIEGKHFNQPRYKSFSNHSPIVVSITPIPTLHTINYILAYGLESEYCIENSVLANSSILTLLLIGNKQGTPAKSQVRKLEF